MRKRTDILGSTDKLVILCEVRPVTVYHRNQYTLPLCHWRDAQR
jgi:hypothetical protein